MAFVLKDRVRETSTTTSTTDFALSATSDYRRFGDAGIMANGDTTLYCAVLGSAWETGIGTWVTGNTLQRTTILESSNANAKVSFGAGVKDIFMDIPASRVLVRDRAAVLDSTLSVGTALTAGLDGSNAIFGPGGTGSINGTVLIDGSSAAGFGARLIFRKNLTVSHYLLHKSALLGSGSSNALVLYNGSTTVSTFEMSDIDDSVIWGGKQKTPASTTARAGLNVPTGVAPTSPVDGDVWSDGTDLKARIGSTTRTLTGPPTTTVLTSGTAATYTTPAGVKWIEVLLVGGGAGGGGGQSATLSTAGGNTTFSTFTAGGGAGSSNVVSGAGGSASGGYSNNVGAPGNAGNSPGLNHNAQGGSGGNSIFGGAGAGVVSAVTGGAATANSGSGGGGGGATNPVLEGSAGNGGASGGAVRAIINNPAATYTYTIGASGAGAAGGSISSSAGGAGGAGGSGRIEVIEHYG